jgi:spore coat protein H
MRGSRRDHPSETIGVPVAARARVTSARAVRATLAAALLFACAPAPAPEPDPDPDVPVEVVPAAPACDPVADGPEARVVEGEAISLSFSCATGADPAGFEVAPAAGPWVIDGWTARWTPGLADAGRHRVPFAVRPRGGGGLQPTDAEVSVADAWDDPQNLPVDPSTYADEWGLPVLHLQVDGALSEDETPATTWFAGRPLASTVQIRGAASAGYPKNSFTVEFDPENLDLDAVGLQRKDHLILISNFDDNSYLRQKLVFDAWAGMGQIGDVDHLAPRTFFTVVYLNGEYHGLYTGIDAIDDEFAEEMGLDRASEVYKSVSHDANFTARDAGGGRKETLSLGWEKKEGADVTDLSTLVELTRWASRVDAADFSAEVGDRIDLDDVIDWFLLVHHFAADDSGGKNAYLLREPREDAIFRYVPWDFNHSLGQTWQTERQGADAYEDFTWTNGLFAHIFADPALDARVWDRYEALRAPGGPLNADHQLAWIDATYASLDGACARDWEKWRRAYRTYGGWSWRRDFTTFDGEAAYLRRWIRDREVFMAEVHPPR